MFSSKLFMYSRLATFLSLAIPTLAIPSYGTSSPEHKASPDSQTSGSYFKNLHLPYYPPEADCHNYMIPVDTEWEKISFNGTKFGNNFDLEDFLTVASTREPGPNYPLPLGKLSKVKETYNIAASFCSPKKASPKAKTVLLATHGIGPARSHWNSPFKPEDYNFVQHAISQGYSVFFYDRLGCGASQKISGYDAQINTSIAVLQGLAKLVRQGKYTGSIGKPSKLALLGFSYGSYTTHGAVALTPELADAVILTAIGFNKTGLNTNGLLRSFQHRIAQKSNPALYGDRDTGYLTWVDKFAQVLNYFNEPNYELGAVQFAEAAKEPYALTEFLTLLSGPQNVDKYHGPALLMSGEVDYIFCDGFCPGIFEEPAKTIYKNAKLQLAIHPGTSHNINLHKNATGAYEVVMDFLKSNGL
ncbi:MAG: hypothetical protein MMC23_007243 [Stictis urceolatum]|nr:hypothetical protein [Stictis urceolata]